MPVIVVGADTPEGSVILDALFEPGREIRAFVSDEEVAMKLRNRGIKVALGDVSDDSHIEAAATRCFTAVLVATAISDGRELAFAPNAGAVIDRWAKAVSGVQRVIWVHEGNQPAVKPDEVAVVSPSDPDLGEKVRALDGARSLRP